MQLIALIMTSSLPAFSNKQSFHLFSLNIKQITVSVLHTKKHQLTDANTLILFSECNFFLNSGLNK